MSRVNLLQKLLRFLRQDPQKEFCRFKSKETLSFSCRDFHSLISRWLYRLKDIKSGNLIFIGLESGPDAIASFFACLFRNLIPAFIAHPSSKISLDAYTYKLNNLIKIHKPAKILLASEHEHLILEKFRLTLTEGSLEPSPPARAKFAQFSSGSTGLPKGMLYTLDHLEAQIEDLDQILKQNLPEQTPIRIASWLPLYHDMGLIACCLYPLFKGYPLLLIDPFFFIAHPADFLKEAHQFSATHTWMPNFAFRLLIQKVKPEIPMQNWRMIASCAEPVEAETLRDFYLHFKHAGLRPDSLAVTYAMAENVFAMTHKQIHMDRPFYVVLDRQSFASGKIHILPSNLDGIKIVACGRALAKTRIRAGRQKLKPVRIQSPYQLHSYWHQKTKALDSKGFFNTGDLGFIWQNELYLAGRQSDMLIVRGVNLWPQEIEQIASSVKGAYPGRAVCFGVEDQCSGTQAVWLACEKKEGADRGILARQIREALHLKADVFLDRILILAHQSLQKTSSGKISRLPNREKLLKSVDRQILILGDSHIYAFNASDELYNQHSTAANISLKQIPIGSSENLDQALRQNEINETLRNLPAKALCLFMFGEQDIRTVIPFLVRHKKLILEDAVIQVTSFYSQWLKSLQKAFPDLEFGFILPPPPGEGLPPHPRYLAKDFLDSESYYHFLADQTDRREIARSLRTNFLQSLPLPLIDIWPRILKDSVTLEIRPQHIRDISHLQQVRELYEDEIERQFNCIIEPLKQITVEPRQTVLEYNLSQEICTLIRQEFKHPVEPVTNLLELLNSIDIVKLMSLLTERYHVVLPANFLDKSQISTTQKLCQWVLAHKKVDS